MESYAHEHWNLRQRLTKAHREVIHLWNSQGIDAGSRVTPHPQHRHGNQTKTHAMSETRDANLQRARVNSTHSRTSNERKQVRTLDGRLSLDVSLDLLSTRDCDSGESPVPGQARKSVAWERKSSAADGSTKLLDLGIRCVRCL